MSLVELSELVNRVITFPIEEVESEIMRLNELIKYTKHSKKLAKYQKQLKILNKFKSMHEIMISSRY